MRRYVGLGESIPGMPMEDMTEEEWSERAKAYAEAWPEDERPAVIASLEASPLWVRDTKKKADAGEPAMGEASEPAPAE